jgi:hypothetical protein
MQTALKIIFISTSVASVLLGFTGFADAQNISQLAYNLKIEGDQGENGEIVSFKDGKYFLSTTEYDSSMYGVIQIDPDLALNRETANTRPVVSNGQVFVRVSRANGEIKEGDLLTTSKDTGIGQKATKSGHVLGKALKDFPNDEDSEETGLIPALININYNQISSQSEALTDAGIDQVAKKVSSSLVSGNIPDLLKYIFALILGAISFFLGLSHFVRSNRTAVESIARNPLAKADIQRQLVIGTAGILAVCGIGLAISVWILIFL